VAIKPLRDADASQTLQPLGQPEAWAARLRRP